MSHKHVVDRAPFIHTSDTVSLLMTRVLWSLFPVFIWACINFGLRTILVVGLAVLFSVLTERVACLFQRKLPTLSDWTAVITGLILGLSLPATVGWYIPVFGSIFAIAVVKIPFGGTGSNIFNPAMAGLAFVMNSWPSEMFGRWAPSIWSYVRSSEFTREHTLLYGVMLRPSDWFEAGVRVVSGTFDAAPRVDGITAATPLNLLLSEHLFGERLYGSVLQIFSVWDMIFGFVPGALGEGSVVVLCISAVLLVYWKIISPWVPVAFIAALVFFSWVFGDLPLGQGWFTGDIMVHLLSGGAIFASIFVITDYTTTPSTLLGKILSAIVIAGLTVWIRLAGTYPEGIAYAVLLGNLLAPLIDFLISPRLWTPRARRGIR